MVLETFCMFDDVVDICTGIWFGVLMCWLRLHPNMGKVILTNVFVYGGIIDLHIYGFLDCSGEAKSLIGIYAEVIYSSLVATGVIVVMYKRGCFKVFLVSFLKCSSRFSNVLFIAVNPGTSIPAYNTTFCTVWVLCPFGIQESSWLFCCLWSMCLVWPLIPGMA